MLAAESLGMIKAGFVFISYELLLDSCKSSTSTAEENARVCKAYEGLLDISLFVPSSREYSNFTREVRRRMSESPFNRAMLPTEKVSSLAL